MNNLICCWKIWSFVALLDLLWMKLHKSCRNTLSSTLAPPLDISLGLQRERPFLSLILTVDAVIYCPTRLVPFIEVRPRMNNDVSRPGMYLSQRFYQQLYSHAYLCPHLLTRKWHYIYSWLDCNAAGKKTDQQTNWMSDWHTGTTSLTSFFATNVFPSSWFNFESGMQVPTI